MSSSDPEPRPLSDVDARVIIGLLAVREGDLLVEELDGQVTDRLRDRSIHLGLLTPGAEIARLRNAWRR
jgi:hypothetical protein